MSKVYEIITERIIEQLDKGTIPWRKPWQQIGMPRNLVSNKGYQGINIVLLGCQGYSSPYWLTRNQAKQMGGSIKEGEKPSMITFWKFLESFDDQGKKRTLPLLRYYKVFNVEQFEELKLPAHARVENQPTPFEPIAAAEKVLSGYPLAPPVTHGGDRACYAPREDAINMPKPEAFESEDSYYATLFHELGHSTGHSSRLDRFENETLISPFGSEDYSKEELIAEFCSAFLSAECNLNQEGLERSAAYIQSWKKKLQEDPKLVVQAAGKAHKAASWIMGRKQYAAKAA